MSGSIAEALAAIRDRVERARVAAGTERVELIGVSKLHPASAIATALEAGLCSFGENYAQELEDKRAVLGDPRLRWHMIGPLQSNKAKRVIGCALVHTVDRPSIIAALDRHAREAGTLQHVLVQVNVDAEPGKSGISPAELPDLLDAFAPHDGVVCDGLMVIPRPGPADAVRSQFRVLRALRDAHAVTSRPRVALRELSMGMSDDFELAIEEGATLVRVGTAIFGSRESG